MKKIVTIAAVTLALGLGSAAQADIRIDARQANQQRQIDAGGRSGKLSRGERDRLTAQQRSIKRLERSYARSGGRFTDGEERRIMRMLDASQANINRLKNNRVRGPGFRVDI